MSTDTRTLEPAFALKPLAVCLAASFLVFGVASAAGTSLQTSGHGLEPAHSAARKTESALAIFLRSNPDRQPRRVATPAGGVTLPVTSCTDDGSGGTLREVVATAGNFDTVDLSALACSTITLTQGAISTSVNNLTLNGPSASALTIDGANADRVLDHEGTGTFKIRHLTISHGQYDGTGASAAGGCIYTAGDIVVTNSIVSDCSVGSATIYGFGGGISASASATLTNVTVTGATATGKGGGVSADTGALVLESSSVSGNSAVRGGGIYSSYGDITVNSSTISGNNTSYGGGGVYTYAGQNITISNSTISGNASGTAGGGIATYYALSVRNSTVAFNSAPVGGGIYLFGAADATIFSSIISNNTSTTGANDIGGSPLTINGSNNVIMSSDSVVPGDTLAADPGLEALANNGGPTPTLALGADSNAIDAGLNPDSLAFDQRGSGFVRTFGSAADIGAFEVQPLTSDRIFQDGFDGS